jgi:hypothetical protein
MTPYKYKKIDFTLDERSEMNDAILKIIRNKVDFDKEEIYNAYTGKGRLHGLYYKDYDNYFSYSRDKKEIEQGQFFTPHFLVEKIFSIMDVQETDTVLDPSCGIGNFFNFVKNKHNCVGVDIDRDSIDVAQYLYPDVKLECIDFQYFNIKEKFDWIVGNPPYNLDFGVYSSQHYFMKKSSKFLKPGGFLFFILPYSYLENDWYANRIDEIIEDLSFVGQVKLDSNSFECYGVKSFKTKLMCFQKILKDEKNDSISFKYMSFGELHEKLKVLYEKRKENKARIFLELHKEKDSDSFQYKLAKYLYQIKTSKKVSGKYAEILNYYNEYLEQKKPETMEWEEWNRIKITENKVLAHAKRIIKKQHENPIDVVKLVKVKGGYKYKPYSNKVYRMIPEKNCFKEWESFDNLVYYNHLQPIKRKIRKNDNALISFDDLTIDDKISNYLDNFRFNSVLNKDCFFTDRQKSDLNKIFQKNYSILNWQQGSGKTPAALAWALYDMKKNVFIVSAAIALNLTWTPFLKLNNIDYIKIDSLKSIRNIKEKQFVLITSDMMIKYNKHLKKYIKSISHKCSFVFDESDEITSHNSKRTKAILNCFRKVKRKLLATGTTTRNNISELYSQLELLYNNSGNMLCECNTIYFANKENKIEEKENKKYNLPYPARGGNILFRSCFNPVKATVFGIEKMNQDVYNKNELDKIIKRTILTKKFKEIVGPDKYEIKSVHVSQNEFERNLYTLILNDYDRLISEYFKSTGNSRKDAMLKLLRQMQLLIKASSIPHTFKEYGSLEIPSKTKMILKMVDKIDERICIGCTFIETAKFYYEQIKGRFKERELFFIIGEIGFNERQMIIKDFINSRNGILITTQQSLKSSVSIPECNHVIIESMQWNIPKIEQFYFRFIRFDSTRKTTVYFVNYRDTIETNLKTLLMAKERLNEYIKTLEFRDESDIFDEYDVDPEIFDMIISKNYDEDGKRYLTWGKQEIR